MATQHDVEARPLRADARRNRERVLEAAEQVFATEGVSAPIDEVARVAGVGVGTCYRHFPTKEALFEAIVLRRLEQLTELARGLSTAEDAGAAFFQFIDRFGALVGEKRDLSDALEAAGVDVKARAAGPSDELRSAATVLLERAQAAGAVRDDVDAADLFGLIVGTCKMADASAPRMLGIVCDGLRPQP